MLSEDLAKKLNEQIQYEFFAESQYLAMAGYYYSKKLSGFAGFFLGQSAEEHQHGMKFFEFINENGGRAVIPGVKAPKNEFKSVSEPVDLALKYEQEGVNRLYSLMNDAIDAKEHATAGFLKWFIDQQVKEVAALELLVNKMKMVGTEGHGLFMLDQKFGSKPE